MTCWTLLALAVSSLHAGVIRGTVVENQTGKFLARAVVAVQPVGGTPGSPASRLTDISGTFEFGGLAAGAYLVKVTRLGFMPAENGQKRWNSAGYPVFLAEDKAETIALRMLRYGTISGTVVDENDVGMPDHEVTAYRNTRPPQPVAKAKSDDRGVYRIQGLEPGSYIVRTPGAHLDEVFYAPTFSKEAPAVEGARTVELLPDQQAQNADVRPAMGRLLAVSGIVSPEFPNVPLPPPPPIAVTVTLATDMGRQSVRLVIPFDLAPYSTPNVFQFPGLSPGPYELYAEAPADDNPIVDSQGAWVLSSTRVDAAQSLALSSRGNLRFLIRGGPLRAVESGAIRFVARRKDLAGVGPSLELKPARDRLLLRPGRWEVLLMPPPGYYVSGIQTGRVALPGEKIRPDAWNEITVSGNGGFVTYTLSSSPGSLAGMVRNDASAVAGAPVFLEAWDDDTRQRLKDVQVTYTDLRGAYSFPDLASGTYRVLATFEYRNPDAEAMNAADRTIRVEAHERQVKDLSLYVMR